jgi:hypothetical protein
VRCVIGTLPLAIQTNALIEEPLVRVPIGLSANGKLDLPDDLRIARFQDVDPALADGGG